MRAIVPFGRRAATILLFMFFSFSCFAQSVSFKNGKYEIGVGIGPSFFLGDLGGGRGTGKTFIKDLDIPMAKLAKGLYFNLYPAEWFGLRIGINKSHLEGSDDQVNLKGGREYSRWRRNQYFQSEVLEAYFGIEIYPTVLIEKYDGLTGKIRPYGIVGVGGFHFNPKGYYYPDPADEKTKKLVELKPLRLEGQGMAEYPDRKEYKLTQIEIPMGAGFKYYFKENVYIGMEILHRKTYTDYIDDVSTKYIDPINFQKYLDPSNVPIAIQLYNREPFRNISRPTTGRQRGDPKEMDSFFSTTIRMGWRINGSNSPANRARKQLKCPVFF